MPNLESSGVDFVFEGIKDYPTFALSKDGKMLALNNKEGILELIETESGKTTFELEINETIADLTFVNNNKTLVLRAVQEYWKVRFFDLETKQEIFFDGIIPKPYEYAFYYSFNADETKLAITYGYYVVIYDFILKKQLHEFQLEHVAKKGNIKFFENDLLGVRTDSGYYSLYKV